MQEIKTSQAAKHVQHEPPSDNAIRHHYVNRKENISIRGKRSTTPHIKSTYKWPNQNKIGSKFLRIWETYVKDIFCHTQTWLNNPLKDWIDGADQSQQCLTFSDHNTGNLIWITGQGGTRQCREHKLVPTKIPHIQQRPRHINRTTNYTLQNITTVTISKNPGFSKIREWSSNRHPRSNTKDAKHT